MKIINHKYKILIILLLINLGTCLSEGEVYRYEYNFSGGLGINIFNSVNLTDYLNSLSIKRFDDFIINPEFFISIGKQVTKNYSLNIDYTYIVNYFNTEILTGNIENQLTLHLPVLMLYRDFYSNGAIVKLGAGLGYSYAIIGRKLFNTSSENFYSNGAGLKLAFELNTPFGDNFYGLISSNLNVFLMSDFKNQSNEKLVFIYGAKNKNLDLDFFYLNLRFGLIYYL